MIVCERMTTKSIRVTPEDTLSYKKGDKHV